MPSRALEIFIAIISSFFVNPCSTDHYDSPSRSRSRKTKRITCNQYPRRLYSQLEMAPTTRRRSKLISDWEVNDASPNDEVMNVTIDPASQRESIDESKSQSPRAYLDAPKNNSQKPTYEQTKPPTPTPSLKERTFSMEMTEAIEALQRAEEAEQLLTPSSIKEHDQDIDTSSDESTKIPTIRVLHRPDDKDNALYSSDEANSSDPDTPTDENSSADLEILVPDTPSQPDSQPLTIAITLSTPPASPLSPSPSPKTRALALAPQATTQQQWHIPPREPWKVEYICYECEQPVVIRGGGSGICDAQSGTNSDKMRCRECGCRVLWKKRTERIVQFEAR